MSKRPARPASDYTSVEAFLNTCDAAQPRRREHHLPREEYARTDVAFFVTLCARHHGTPFQHVPLAENVSEGLQNRSTRKLWHVYAYCVMPDHFHAVIQRVVAEGRPSQGDLLQELADFKSYTTRCAWKCGFPGKLWQHDQHDRLLRNDREFSIRCQYVLNNPVRKGWVDDWTLWPYSGILDDW